MSDELRAVFSGEGPPSRTGRDREAAIAALLEGERPYAGARGLDEEALRALLGRVYDRSASMPSANNHFLVDGSDSARARLAEIAVPTLVDPWHRRPAVSAAHGEALAREIHGARLLVDRWSRPRAPALGLGRDPPGPVAVTA